MLYVNWNNGQETLDLVENRNSYIFDIITGSFLVFSSFRGIILRLTGKKTFKLEKILNISSALT